MIYLLIGGPHKNKKVVKREKKERKSLIKMIECSIYIKL